MKTIHIIANGDKIMKCFSNQRDALKHLKEGLVYTIRTTADPVVYEHMLKRYKA